MKTSDLWIAVSRVNLGDVCILRLWPCTDSQGLKAAQWCRADLKMINQFSLNLSEVLQILKWKYGNISILVFWEALPVNINSYLGRVWFIVKEKRIWLYVWLLFMPSYWIGIEHTDWCRKKFIQCFTNKTTIMGIRFLLFHYSNSEPWTRVPL